MDWQKRIGVGMDVVATIAAIAGCGLVLYFNWPKLVPRSIPVPSVPVSLSGAAVRGSGSAPVVVIEFSDYFCPYCARAEREIIPALQEEYVEGGKVMLAFRHHPLEQLHPGATAAAVAAVCAGRVGRFWEMHATLFDDHAEAGGTSVLALVGALGMDAEEFSRCFASSGARSQVAEDVAQADALGLAGTPAFLIGRRQPDGRVRVLKIIDGARPASEFQSAIEAALDVDDSGRTQAIALGAGGMIALVAAWVLIKRRSVGVLTSR